MVSASRAERELAKVKRQNLRLKNYIFHHLQLRPQEALIRMEIPKCHEQIFHPRGFSVYSEPVELAGFQWKLRACNKEPGWLGLYLKAIAPSDYAGHFRFELNIKFKLIHHTNESASLEVLSRNDVVFRDMSETGVSQVIQFKNLLYKPYDFLAEDGTARLEALFKITEGTITHFTRNHLADEASDSSSGGSSSDTSDTAATSEEDNREDSGNVPDNIDG